MSPCIFREYALTIDSESIELCYAENEKKAREQLGQKVLDLFKKYCFTIVVCIFPTFVVFIQVIVKLFLL